VGREPLTPEEEQMMEMTMQRLAEKVGVWEV
jgi:hypothetical protein